MVRLDIRSNLYMHMTLFYEENCMILRKRNHEEKYHMYVILSKKLSVKNFANARGVGSEHVYKIKSFLLHFPYILAKYCTNLRIHTYNRSMKSDFLA